MRKDVRGEYLMSDPPQIMVSAALNGHLLNVLQTLAHEMVHLAQHHSGTAGRYEHNRDFLRRAKLICRSFGWDERVF